MWSTMQSLELFSTFVEHPRLTTIISSATPDGPRFRVEEAADIAAAIRIHAADARVPVVVRMRGVERQPGYARIVVYHVPDVTGTRMPQ